MGGGASTVAGTLSQSLVVRIFSPDLGCVCVCVSVRILSLSFSGLNGMGCVLCWRLSSPCGSTEVGSPPTHAHFFTTTDRQGLYRQQGEKDRADTLKQSCKHAGARCGGGTGLFLYSKRQE